MTYTEAITNGQPIVFHPMTDEDIERIVERAVRKAKKPEPEAKWISKAEAMKLADRSSEAGFMAYRVERGFKKGRDYKISGKNILFNPQSFK